MTKANLMVVGGTGTTLLEIQKMLMTSGYTVAATASLSDVLQKASELRPDLVLWDIRLENEDEIVEASRVCEQLNLPVVFLVNESNKDFVQSVGTSEPFEYVTDLTNSNDLFRRVDRALQNHALRSKLRESEKRYRTLLETMNDGVGQVDGEGKIVFANQKLCQLTGYSKEELVGRRHTSLFPAEMQRQQREEFAKRKSGDVNSFETVILRKDGTRLPVILSGSSILDETGKFSSVIGVFTEISERKQGEEILLARYRLVKRSLTASLSELLQATLDEVESLTGSQVGFFHFVESDQVNLSLQAWSTNTIRMCNAEGAGLHYPIHDAGVWVDGVHERMPIIHNDYKSLAHRKGVPEGHVEIERELVVPVLRGDKIVAIVGVGNKDTEYVRKDVEIVSLLADLTWDIVERKQTEAALHKSEALYRDLVETAQDLIWQCDQDGRYIYLNPAWEDVFGYKVEEMLGRHFSEFQDPEFAQRDREEFRKILQGNTVNSLETVHLAKDGQRLYLVFNAKVVRDAQGSIKGTRGTAYNVTGIKQNEAALKKSEYLLQESQRIAMLGHYELDVVNRTWKSSDLLNELFGIDWNYCTDIEGWLQIVHPDDRDEMEAYFAHEVVGKCQHFDKEYRIVRASDGATRWVHGLGRLEFDESGKPIYMIGNIQDITERKQTEQSLIRRAEELAALQETILEIIFPHSLHDLLGFIVERAATLIGASGGGLYLTDPEKHQVHCVVSYNTQRDYTGTILAYGEGAAGHVAQSGAPLLIDDYRSWLGRAGVYEEDQPFYSVISAPLLWQGTVSGVLHLLREEESHKFTREDLGLLSLFANHAAVAVENARLHSTLANELNERKQAEMAVLESERRYRSIVESSPLGMHIYELQSPDRLVFVGANPAADKILGVVNSQFAGKTIEDAFPALADTEVPLRYKEAATKGIPWKTEQINYDADGIKGAFEVMVFQISPNRIAAMFQDITARRRAEESLRMRTGELEALFSISSHLRIAQSADAMLPVVAQELRRVLKADANAIILLEPDDGQFTYALADGALAANTGQKFGIENSISGLVLKSRQAYVTENLSIDPKKTSGLSGTQELGPTVVVPLLSEEAFMGVIVCARINRADAPRFSPSEVQLLTAIGEMVGNAMRRARLYDQALTRLQHVQTLHSIDMAITANFDLTVVLDVLLSQGLSQLAADAACILLLNPHTRILEYAAGSGFRSAEVKSTRLRLGEGLPGLAAIERKTIFVPNLSESSHLVRKYLLGEGFVSYQTTPLIAKGQLQGVMEIFNRKNFSGAEEQKSFLETLATQAAIAIENSQLFTDLQRSNFELEMAYDATIEGWSRALELRDQDTEGHTLRVTDMTLLLAQAMNVRGDELIHIRRGALLHDIGKMGVPDQILLKPGKLSNNEWEIMKQHTEYAFEMLWPIEFLRPAIDIPHYHHERWDGNGYPSQLMETQIPMSARLFAIADVWDALTNDRPYRKAWKVQKALDHIKRNSGKHFDPQVVELFLDILKSHGGFQRGKEILS